MDQWINGVLVIQIINLISVSDLKFEIFQLYPHCWLISATIDTM